MWPLNDLYQMTKDKKALKSVNQPIDDERIIKIAEKIKQLRKEAGFTNYEEFAWEHDFKRSQYWRIEKGANITLVSLLKVLDAHKMSLSEFFGDIT